ncbi:MAG: GAF domain-containing protein [Salinivirgaceae bacterium]
MDEILKYKKRVILNFVLLLIASVLAVLMVLGASTAFRGNGTAIVLLAMFLIQIPLILNLGLSGLRAINHYIENEERRRVASGDDIEELEKEVEEKAREADELSFNLTRLEEEMGQFNDLATFGERLLVGISKQIEIVVGMVYVLNDTSKKYAPIASYAYYSDSTPPEFEEGDGLIGQVVKDKKAMFINELPAGYVNVISGLGSHKPSYLAIIPVIDANKVIGVVELATFKSIERGLANRVNDLSKFFGNKAKKLV